MNWSTPHARGSTRQSLEDRARETVYPACAGIHPVKFTFTDADFGLPRMRGDPPPRKSRDHTMHMSTPHARGSTLTGAGGKPLTVVYPACAGIHLWIGFGNTQRRSLPRMRGDPPNEYVRVDCENESTPHARGSTRR